MYGLTREEFFVLSDIFVRYRMDIKWVMLFGSRAVGDYQQASDIDLAICFRDETPVRLSQEIEESTLPYQVDLVNYEEITNQELLGNINRQGICIFKTNGRGEPIVNFNKVVNKRTNFTQALSRLKAVLAEDLSSNDIVLDATIQRFEFTYELAWKLVKSYLEYQGIEAASPRESIREAFKIHLIADATAWLQMLESRNRTPHTYDQQAALDIYNKVKGQYVDLFDALEQNLDSVLKE